MAFWGLNCRLFSSGLASAPGCRRGGHQSLNEMVAKGPLLEPARAFFLLRQPYVELISTQPPIIFRGAAAIDQI